jgi:hypothetical protein
MALGYGGIYRAVVVDNLDPLARCRLSVVVPDVYGDSPVWAAASLTGDDALPAIGDEVRVSFEHGDSDYPVWEHGAGSTGDDRAAPHGYIGRYRATVTDNLDPLDEHRLQVIVPEVSPERVWATAALEVGELPVPDIDAAVWVEYEDGDPNYPRWVGDLWSGD